MEEILIVYGKEEYFCQNCKQLRLNATHDPIEKCGNCGSVDIIIGKVGELDKRSLLKCFRRQ